MASRGEGVGTFDRALARELPGVVVQQDRTRRWQYHAPCVDCPEPRLAFTNAAKLPVEKIRIRLTDLGWRLSTRANKHRCPDHATAPRAPVEEPRMPDVKEPIATPSDKARVARREAMLLLSDVFDLAAGRYKGNDSDKTVADACGLSVEAVAKLREDFYGPLKVPSELEALDAALIALRTETGAAFAALRADIDAQERAAVAKLSAMDGRLADALRKFA